MEEFKELLEDQFFIIDSFNLESIEERLYGYSFNNNNIIFNKDIKNKPSLDPTGTYVFVEVDEDNIKISQDFNGSYGIYIYQKNDYFAISNSFLKLVEYLKYSHVLSLNKDYADAFLFADLVSFAYCDTLVNEINLIPRNYIININKKDLTLNFSEIDYQESTVSLDSKEAFELLDKWYYKWINIIRNLKSKTNNLIIDLTGGFDSRVIAALWLTSNIDFDKFKINSRIIHKEDYEIASEIGKVYNFKLNQYEMFNNKNYNFNEIYTPLKISFYVRLGFHKRMIFKTSFTSKPMFYITGSGGESLRDSNPTPDKYLDNMKTKLNRDDLDFFNPSKRVIINSFDKLSKKFNIDIDSSEITEIHRKEVRNRNHFGKNAVTNYLINSIAINPLLDPIIRRLKLKTLDCNDNNLLYATILTRYCPELLNFKFDMNREINQDTIDCAFLLNDKYPFYKKDLDFISGPEIINKKNSEDENKYITPEDIDIFLRDTFLSKSFKMEFKKYYSDYDYNIISNKLNQNIDNSFKNIYSEIYTSIAIIKIANDCTFSQLNNKDIGSWFNQFKQNNDGNHINQDNLIKYNSARIQIRNMKKGNSIEIIDSKGINKITAPKWFNGKMGQGLVLNSFNNSMDLKFKCIKEGKLLVKLSAPFVLDKLNNKFPVFIDYTNFEINGKKIIDKNTLVNHGNPFTYYKNVKDGEIIKLKISWLPFNENSVYKKEEFTSYDNNTENNNSISDNSKKNNISVSDNSKNNNSISDNSKKNNNNPQKEKKNSIFKKIFRQ